MCTRRLKHSVRGLGILYESICNKPEYKDGLCAYHYKKVQSKLINWIDRPGYRQVTIDEFERGCSIKLKHTHNHRIFRYQKGIIQENKQDQYIDTDIPVDINLYCIKRY